MSPNLPKSQTQIMLQNMADEIQYHNKAYFIDNTPLISDAEYDLLVRRFKKIASQFPQIHIQNNPLEQVGDKPQAKFGKISHTKPMLSLENAFNEEDFEDFITKCQRFLMISYFPELACELKIDGLSFNAHFKQGVLQHASTRGDGFVGENITQNLKTIENFPQIIDNKDDIFEVRGEIYIDKDDFAQINQTQRAAGLAEFANPRNAAAGSIRHLDPKITASRRLKYFVYAVGELSNQELLKDQAELLKICSQLGFCVNPVFAIAKSFSQVEDFYTKAIQMRDQLSYEIDGAVFKINDFALQQRLGSVGKTPRFAIAYKFPALIASTMVLNIKLQVGRTGAITPVAELEPVAISGAIINKATLHNFQDIQRKDIRIGDYVFLSRAGDVIPKISHVDFTRRQNVTPIEIPKSCPACGMHLEINQLDAILRCDNTWQCPSQIFQRIAHFASRDGLNIVGLGKKQIECLLEHNLIQTLPDIFKLDDKSQMLAKIDGWGAKSVQNLLENIQIAKQTTLDKFIYSLGIRYIGQNNSTALARYCASAQEFCACLAKISNKDATELARLDEIDGIGTKVLQGIREFSGFSQNILTTNELAELLEIQDYRQSLDSKISALNIVFTGSLSSISRAEARSIAEKLGAKVGSAISANTDILVAGEKSGSKVKKALELGIKVIDEEEWNKLIKNN